MHHLQYEYCTAISLNSSGRLIACALNLSKTIQIFEFNPLDKQKCFTSKKKFNDNIHSDEILKLHINDEGNVIVSCGIDTDTFIKVWNLNGDLLSSHNTHQVKHYCAYFTNVYFFIGTWGTDVKVNI